MNSDYYYMIAPYQNELKHYGVKGMQWGIRRGVKILNSAYYNGGVDRGAHNYAIATLDSHKEKINKKLKKISSKNDKLQTKAYVHEIKTKPQIASLHSRSMRYKVKADRTKNEYIKEKYLAKSNKLEYKATSLNNKVTKVKAKIAKNERLANTFKEGLNTINKETVDKGRHFLYMRSNGMPYMQYDIDSWTPIKK